MTRLPLLVGACLLVAAVGGALAGAPASAPDERSATSDPGAASDTVPGTASDAAPDDRTLVVEDAETGERLLAVPVTEGTAVALNYTHSVQKTPVLDVYAVNGTSLEMVRMEFHSYGAGLPARADVNVTEDGAFVFDPEGSYDRLYVTPGTIAGHELVVGERTFDLVERSDARTVKIYVAGESNDAGESTATASRPSPTTSRPS